MKPITFIDLEVHPKKRTILDIGAINDGGSVFHAKSEAQFAAFLKGSEYLCGHNIINHDLKYIKSALVQAGVVPWNVIDTLYLSALLFPRKPYHALLKDEKLQTDEMNNPLTDAIKARELLNDEILAFSELDGALKQMFFLLLGLEKEFAAFFRYIDYTSAEQDAMKLIREHFAGEICERANLRKLISEHPVALAYALATINVRDRFSITPPWVLKSYPQVEWLMDLLRNRPCLEGCPYCNRALDARWGLKHYFGFDNYRTFGGEPLQENAVNAALLNKSILAIFPTGGGKSVTFQVPALMSGENIKGLTVIISPLQSLMKDQVDNLERAGITAAVTINGLLDPIERAKSLERVEDGSASILYISPESLRSRTIEHLLLGRKIARFVIDEAHCFSAWGQDFRVDYLYIGDFIRDLQKSKGLVETIPVSCFTATAKPKVIEDIKAYFKDKLGLELTVFSSSASRTNLQYKVIEKSSQEEKYEALRNLIEQKQCPTIVYVSRTKAAEGWAERLTRDGFMAKPYHGQMEAREKSANQDAFIAGEVPIIVATSAFGMGVDKKDVGMVIHFEISDSLENYIQEAGRAGRDEAITADCYVLFCEEDLDKHFALLNRSRINGKEIQQVWKAIKELTRLRKKVSQSALEIARKAGWDESIDQLETRVRTAISALEQSGYVKRGQNMARVYADSILSRNAQEAIEKINASSRFSGKDEEDAIRIIKKLISSRSQSQAQDEAVPAQVDYISDHLGIPKERVILSLNLLREEGILADAKDLTAYIKRDEKVNRSRQVLDSVHAIEKYLASRIDDQEETYNLKELNEEAAEEGCLNVTPARIRMVLNYWAIKRMVKYANAPNSKNHLCIMSLEPRQALQDRLQKKQEVARFILDYLYSQSNSAALELEKEEVLVGFSVHEVKRAYEESAFLFKVEVSIEDIEDALFYLSRIDAVKIEGGFLIIYNPMTIERLEDNPRKLYTADDYTKMGQYYANKIQQIHIVGEYARKMIDDYRGALQFVEDYFRLNYARFISKYFPGSREEEISRNITPSKFRQLFGELSPRQLSIIKDSKSKYIVVLAGPGSGKTRVLVHKLASLILMEDVKHEQLLMLTFSRAAATEFKVRLRTLVGSAANYIEIKTFHSYCFDLLGRVGNLEKSDQIINSTIEKIQSGEVELSKITKTVLVIDEAQDMDESSYALVQTLMTHNETMRVIAVGDDDQNIFEFRGSSAKYMAQFIADNQAMRYELLENYRSKHNLVEFSNQFVLLMRERLKENPIVAHKRDNGTIRVVGYTHNNLLVPFVNDIAGADLAGTTCALTRTNNEALQVTGMLQKRGIPARLIQTNDAFSLYDLVELRFFIFLISGDGSSPLVSKEVWNRAKTTLVYQYKRSSMLEVCKRIILDYQATNEEYKYISDFEAFVRESKLEDFQGEMGEVVFVSTIHKAKGKEFDNVFLLLENFDIRGGEEKRQLYVAMTRAKTNLAVHLNASYLNHIQVENMTRLEDSTKYTEPDHLALQLSHSDVYLNYFEGRQHVVRELRSGDKLLYRDGEWLSEKERSVFQPSTNFSKTLDSLRQQGYIPVSAKVNFMVWWKGKEQEQDIQIVLPELHLERGTRPFC